MDNIKILEGIEISKRFIEEIDSTTQKYSITLKIDDESFSSVVYTYFDNDEMKYYFDLGLILKIGKFGIDADDLDFMLKEKSTHH